MSDTVRGRYLVPLLVFVCAAAVVSAVLRTPFSGDDAFNAYLEGWTLAHHGSLLQTFDALFNEWDVGRGRFIPLLQVINVLQFHLFWEPAPLKAMQVFAVAFDVALFYVTVRELGASMGAGAAASVIVILTLQVRSWYDPLAQYNLHLPLATACGLSSVLFAARFRQSRAVMDYVLAVLAFAAATLTYEIFMPLAIALISISGCGIQERTRRVAAALPFGAIVAAELAAVALIRHAVPQPAGGAYSPNLFAAAYLPTAFWQFTGALPFAYAVIDPQSIFRNHPGWWHTSGAPAAIAGLTAAAAIIIAAWNRTAVRPSSSCTRACVLSGLALAAGPALLLASSPFYQGIVKPGLAYIPVYAQGFGIAFLCIPLFALPRRRTCAIAYAGALAGGIACALTASANAVAAGGFDVWGFPRETIVRGLRAAGSDIPAGALVFVDDSYIVNERFEPESTWNNVWFYRLFGGTVWRIAPLKDETSTPERSAAELRSSGNTREQGTFLRQHIERPGFGRFSLRSAEIFERGAGTGISRRAGLAFRADDFTMQSRGHGWRLDRFTPRCSFLPVDALLRNSPSLGVLEYGRGFGIQEHDGAADFRWAGRHSELTIRNESATPIETNLTASIQTAGTARGTLLVHSPRAQRIRVPLSSAPALLRVAVRVPARGSVSVALDADAPNVALPGDPRDVRARLSNVSLHDATGCAAADAASSVAAFTP